MAKTVFYSFYYKQDAWRVQQIVNMGALDGQPILNAQDWEQVKAKGSAAVEKWIDEQMSYKRTVVVLIGSQTASRPWVQYEISKAWNAKKSLVGIRINGLADSAGNTDSVGQNPFAQVALDGGGTVADYVPIFTPTGATSKEIHADIAANITTWVDSAYKP
jgi:hypothetical protein